MLKVAVCDDDELIQVQVEKLVKSMNCLISIKKYDDKSIILDIKEFDIVLMDIEVGNSSGLALAAEARKQNPNVIIIFITSYTKYISDSFDVIPFQYLVKPLDETRLLMVLKKAILSIKNKKSFVEYFWNGYSEAIQCANIMYIENFRRNSLIHLKNSDIKKSSIMSHKIIVEVADFINKVVKETEPEILELAFIGGRTNAVY